jgi:hypothetical protein
MLYGPPQFQYGRAYVRFFIGANEPSAYIVTTARAYHTAITSRKSYQTVPDAAHEVPHSQTGTAAMLASLREVAGIH